MKKYHLATFLVSLETLPSDFIFTKNGNYCTLFCILCLLYNLNYSIHIRMFVHSNKHLNTAKFVWALHGTSSSIDLHVHTIGCGLVIMQYKLSAIILCVELAKVMEKLSHTGKVATPL